jgi:hypothetical protein
MTIVGLALLGVLGYAAFVPGVASKLVSALREEPASQKFDRWKATSASSWEKIEHDAAGGDADAMYSLGNRLQHHWQTVNGTLMAPDSAGAARLYRASAAAGNVAAQLEVWKLDGGGQGELVRIAKRAASMSAEPRLLAELGVWLREAGLKTCDRAVFQAIEQVDAAIPATEDNDDFKESLLRMSDELIRRCRPELEEPYVPGES